MVEKRWCWQRLTQAVDTREAALRYRTGSSIIPQRGQLVNDKVQDVWRNVHRDTRRIEGVLVEDVEYT